LSVSGANVEIVRRAWSILATRGVDALLKDFPEFFDDDSVLEDFPDLPDRAHYVGPAGAREIDQHFREMWGELVQEPIEFIDVGDDLVVAVIAMRGNGKGSGVPLDAKAAWVHELEHGKVVRMRAFTTKAQALEAAGHSE
jgi:ketosteroid isomerase-like protein